MRGLGGIDGTVSYAAGIALALDRPTHLLLGDLSLMHDSGGLAIPALEARPLLRIVLMNDSGGGIFETLEPARADLAETFERFFAVPHSISFQKLAAAVGVGYQRADSAEDLAGALRRPISGLELVEVALDRSTRRDFEQRLLAEASTEDPIPSQFT
jgi:2-succinyl-5-enolpyruvyl-6-hydroxy-3-cyclohexene-1-carboxylate synthase